MNTRGIKILKYLLENGTSSIKELSENFETTVRTIYYDIDRIDYRLKKDGLNGIVKEGKGITLHEADLDRIKDLIKEEPVFSPKERVLYLSIKLLCKGMIRLGREADLLQVNRKSIESDMKELKKIFKSESVDVISLPGKGIIFRGEETNVRILLIKSLYVAFLKKDYLRAVFKELIEEIHKKYKPEKADDIIYELYKRVKINTSKFTFLGFIVVFIVGKIREGTFKESDLENNEFLEYDFIDDILEEYGVKLDKLSRYFIKSGLRDSSYEIKASEDRDFNLAEKFIEEFKEFEDTEIWDDKTTKALILKLRMALFKIQNGFEYEADYLKKDLPEDMGPLQKIVKKVCKKLYGDLLKEDIFDITLLIQYALKEYRKQNRKFLKAVIVDSHLGRYILGYKLETLKKTLPLEILDLIPADNLEKYLEKTEEKIDIILSFERFFEENKKSRIGIPIVELNPFLPEKSLETLRLHGLY